MSRFFIVLVVFASIAVVASAQCGASDHPNCVIWASNGFCTNKGYTKALIQQNCPKTCPNVGCTSTRPSGATQIGPVIGGECPRGTTLEGSVCCQRSAGTACATGKALVGPQSGGGQKGGSGGGGGGQAAGGYKLKRARRAI